MKENYQNGLVDFQRVLDSERTKFSTEDELAVSRGQIAKDYVVLYKALGGGTETQLIEIPEASVRARGGPLGLTRLEGETVTTANPDNTVTTVPAEISENAKP